MSACKRPTRPTDQITAECVRYLKAGAPLDVVARLILGAKHDEMFRWLLIGSGEDKTFIRIPKPYRVFYDAVTRAQAAAEAAHALVLAKGGARWSLEWLKRRAPERWTAPSDVVANTEAERELVASIRALRSEPYVDPRDRPQPAALAESSSPEPPSPRVELLEPIRVTEDVEVLVPARPARPESRSA